MRKVVLVTGASSGLGEVIAQYLTSKGYIVYGGSRNITSADRPFHAIRMNVCEEDSVKDAIQKIIKEQRRIDVLVNSAGLGLVGPIEHLSISDVLRIIDTNVVGVLRTTQAVLPSMRQQKSGLIINISSIAATNGLPYRAAYSASKAALDRITESLRTELSPFNIQSCYIQPGGVRTDINRNRIVTTLSQDSAYKESWERCHQIIKDSVSTGLSPDIFGPIVEKIILSDRVKRCYRVGSKLEKMSVVLKQILPAKRFEKLISSHYKL